MATMSFGQAAASLGFVTEADVQECTRVQQKMREMGVDEPLGEIMIKKGRLTAQQHQQILKKLGIHVSPIPGYSLLSKIGQGGMGTVYKANQASVNRTVAIKIMSPQATHDPTFVARFLKEAQAAGTLNHKNLIAAIDVGAAGGYYYFVMEYVVGKSCREIVNEKGPFDEAGALRIALQMAEVLEHIHQHKMVHRDIKPENILLTSDQIVKLCDLGLAKSTAAKDQSLTQEGLTVGTPYFMSPEQIRGEKDIDIRADLYSLGATLYYLVAQRHPFEGKSAAETMSMHLKQAVPDVRKLVPRISEDFSHVLHKLMAKNRGERYQTPNDLAEDLRTIQGGSAPRLARAHAARAPKANSTARIATVKPRTVAVPYLVAGGVAILGLAAWMMRPAPQTAAAPKPAAAAAPVTIVKVVETKGAEKKDDPARLNQATQLLARAEQAYGAERWVEARDGFKQLDQDFGSLEFTRSRSSSINKLIGECDAKIQRLADARTRQVQDARRDLQDGRWKEAAARFQALGETEFAGELVRCRQELEAEAVVAQLKSAQETSNWTEIRLRVEELDTKYPDTQTANRQRNSSQALLARARAEQETKEMLAGAFAAHVRGDWPEAQRLLAEIEKRRDTEAYRANASRLRDLAPQLAAGIAKQSEDQAKQEWAAAVQGYENCLAAKKYDESVESLKSYQRAQAHTKFCESKKSEVEVRIAEAGRRKKSEREEEARKLWSSAQRDMKAQNFDAAMDAVNRLLGDLADTSSARMNDKALRNIKTLCEEGQGVPDNVLIMLDFEDFPGSWSTHGAAKAVNGLDAYQGRRAGRLTMSRGNWISHPLQGVTWKADSVSFYARSLKKVPVAVVYTWMSTWDETDGTITYTGPSMSLTTDWKLYTFKVSDFKTDNAKAKTRILNPSEKVRTIGWEAAAEAGDCEIQIDALRIEARR
jgi:serine/threonine-protein kinase